MLTSTQAKTKQLGHSEVRPALRNVCRHSNRFPCNIWGLRLFRNQPMDQADRISSPTRVSQESTVICCKMVETSRGRCFRLNMFSEKFSALTSHTLALVRQRKLLEVEVALSLQISKYPSGVWEVQLKRSGSPFR